MMIAAARRTRRQKLSGAIVVAGGDGHESFEFYRRNDEAKSRAGMAMRPGDLAGHHDLDVGDQRVAGGAGQPRIA
jgi:hypothetical protein